MTTRRGELPFVGRRAELAAVEQELSRRDGGLSTIVVAGEPGIGKTRFLTEVRRCAQQHGWRTPTGRAARQFPPLSAITDALTPVLLADPSVLDGLPRRLVEALSTVLPALHGDPGRAADIDPGGRAAGPQQVRVAVGALLDQLALNHPVLVTLDDAHEADVSTVELIDYLIRHPFRGRVILAIAYRPRQVPGPLAAVLSRATCNIRLHPLSPTETASLLGPATSAVAARKLHDAADGNPLYLISLARAGADHWSTDLQVPADVGAALCAEVAGLPTQHRAVVQAAAVLGSVFDPKALPAVADLPPSQVWAAVDDLMTIDLLRADAGSGDLQWRHPLLRQVVYRAMGAGWQRAAHARAAQLLSAQAAPAELLAPHVALSATIGDDVAIRVLVRAASALQHRAPATAARWYDAALRLLPVDWRRPARRGRLLLAWAQCLMRAGRLTESHRAAREAVSLLRHRARPVFRRAVQVAAEIGQLRGRYDEVAALLRRTCSEPGLEDPDLQVRLATAELLRGDLAAAGELVRTLHGEPDDPSARFGIVSALAFVHGSCGDVPAATRAANTAQDLLDGLSDAALARQLPAALWLMQGNIALTRYRRVLQDQSRAAQLCRTRGELPALAQLLIVRAEATRRIGRLDEAAHAAAEALELARLVGSDPIALLTTAILCRIALWQGKLPEAHRLGADVEALAAPAASMVSATALVVAGEAQLLAGRPLECIDRLLAAGGGDLLPRMDVHSRAGCYEMLTRAALDAGRVGDAQRWVQLAVTHESQHGDTLPAAIGHGTLAQAQLLLVSGSVGEAAKRAGTAASEFDRVGNPLDSARARLVAAHALSTLGRRGEALKLTQIAEQIACESGAHRLRDEATRQLRRLGRRSVRPATRRRPGAGIHALSERELQVAELAAQGRTNRAIAATLFLSEKTIERHLSAAFTKLGISCRAALAAHVVTQATSA